MNLIHHHGIGNSIFRIRHEHDSPIVFHDKHEQLCAFCGRHKPTKGGSHANKRMWKCKDCVDRENLQ